MESLVTKEVDLVKVGLHKLQAVRLVPPLQADGHSSGLHSCIQARISGCML